ncbi:class F sortase [Streptomyces sp. TLI_146]|uniref:class F sortase n=1 Tax=Streptomyces sp. TLI_146 TaxID=1938858 RepID=UPI000C6FE199|nr:class F sortase [Streptomyces sp. TLI_146]PKV84863.1 sortase family protein [Streptomyces sp. TLI_146]
MAPRSGSPRPFHRTRAYRLTRTAALAATLVVGGVWWAQDDGSVAPVAMGTVGAGGAATPSAPTGADGDKQAPGAPAAPAVPGAKAPAPGGRGRFAGHAAPARPPRPLPPSRATGLAIPYLSLKAPVVGLGLDRARHLATPPVDDPKLVGWYQGGPTPGEAGTALAVGHRDTRTGAAVFANISMLKPGRLVEARRADGRVAVYTVDAVRKYDKAHFPNEEVYGPRNRPELRLITCGGKFDRKKGYESNVVVFAHLTAVR